MKALLYKEFALAMHPICYIFIFAFPLMVLIPSYPVAIGFIYVLSCYPILFLGANKGQQSNDLLFSTLLPIRKKDIVLARIITVALMQLTFILISSALAPVGMLIRQEIIAQGGEIENVGLGLDAFMSVVAFAIVGFAIADLIFFPIYYKKGKSIVMSTLLTILFFAVYLAVFTIILPYSPIGESYVNFFANSGIIVQIVALIIAIIIYIGVHIGIYALSSKRLERVDF